MTEPTPRMHVRKNCGFIPRAVTRVPAYGAGKLRSFMSGKAQFPGTARQGRCVTVGSICLRGESFLVLDAVVLHPARSATARER
jgi:hypothetical protein